VTSTWTESIHASDTCSLEDDNDDDDDTNNDDSPTLPQLSGAPNSRMLPFKFQLHCAMLFLTWFAIFSKYPLKEICR
jgi:hypothetical protein